MLRRVGGGCRGIVRRVVDGMRWMVRRGIWMLELGV
jgi:hypothetical protein